MVNRWVKSRLIIIVNLVFFFELVIFLYCKFVWLNIYLIFFVLGGFIVIELEEDGCIIDCLL